MNSYSNLPPPFTAGAFNKERLQGLTQRVRFLQAQGAKEETNPEYAQIMQFLKSIQRQQSRPAPDLLGIPSMNEFPIGPPPIPFPTSLSSEPTCIFSQSQLAALKCQILAYKLISKNMLLPPNLQQVVLAPVISTNIDSITAAGHSGIHPGYGHDFDTVTSMPILSSHIPPPVPIPSSVNHSQLEKQSGVIKIAEYNAYASPYHLLKKPIASFAHASRQQRLLVPSITTQGIDPVALVTERERRILGRIQYRIGELEKKHNSSKNVKAAVELKALKLLNKQRQLREELINGVSCATALATCTDRVAYRRMKKQSLKEARITEKMERQQRIDRDQREKQKHLDYLQNVCTHGRDLYIFQKTYQADKIKLGRSVLQFHQHVEKEEQKRMERISKERLKALKNDDEEAYMKLIDEAKDTRLTHLLKQTGTFLESLTKAVVDQQNDPIYKADTTDDFSADDPDAKSDYFQVTHRIKEQVSQPSILIGGRLKDYQLKGLQWMVSLYNNHLNGILADEMGLGKTIQTISLVTYLVETKRQIGPFLIIVPLSTLTNWTLEFEKWAPSIKIVVYKGAPNIRREIQSYMRHSGFQVLLTTFEYIIKDRPVLSRIKWLHMIVDEGHRMKNTNSKLTAALRQYYHSRYRLILTGTPLQNNLPELWALLNFVLPRIFKSVKSFEEWFNSPFNNQGVQEKIGLNEEEQLLIIKRLHKVLRPFLLRRLKRDVEAELPDKVERVLKCKLSPLQIHLYNQIKHSGTMYISETSKGKSAVKGLNNTIMQLRKVCNHPFVFEEVENIINPSGMSNDLLFRTSGKFELLDRMLPKLKQTGHRILIFFQMTQVMSIMEDFLNYKGFTYLRLDGSTKSEDRSESMRLFNAPDSPYFIFLLSTRAGGLGLNLQTADTVIIFDSDWNPHQDLQAQDRAHRIGQTKEVRIFRLICSNSVEESILARANYKLDIDGKVIQAGKFDNRSTEEDREAFLRSLLEDKVDEENEQEDDDWENEELNEILQRADSDLAVFQRIDSEREDADAQSWRLLGHHGKPERLITDKELPDIYLNDNPVVDDHDNPYNYGRGQRVKSDVLYDDGLTEEQWVKALEDEDVDLDELIAQRQPRKKRSRGTLLDDDDSSSEDHKRSSRQRRENSATDETLNKKRGRPKKGNYEPKHKRGKKVAELNRPDMLLPHVREQMTRIFYECYKTVEEATEEDEETYRIRSELFMDLVDKRDYPLYYTMIKTPISMNMINKRMNSTYYRTIAHFREDFHTMFNNARIFNEEDSYVYEDANELQRLLDIKLSELCPNGVMPINHNVNQVHKQGQFYIEEDDDDEYIDE
ncbi:hypothetical protein K501DRAFT_250303 [Backusella circina FSU 941]|nr:hypothetical protein K501DRAFT_250303 [Backusella circina FSU 941]